MALHSPRTRRVRTFIILLSSSPCQVQTWHVPIFVIAEWATLLVDIHCPRGGS